MKNVLVSWQTDLRPAPSDSKPAHHFRLGLALQEVDLPLTATDHLFQNVEAGIMSGFITVCADDGTELQPPKVYSVEVPQDVMVPVVVSINGQVQA
jgi:hypothetical protein